jgi:hypothetical protein
VSLTGFTAIAMASSARRQLRAATRENSRVKFPGNIDDSLILNDDHDNHVENGDVSMTEFLTQSVSNAPQTPYVTAKVNSTANTPSSTGVRRSSHSPSGSSSSSAASSPIRTSAQPSASKARLSMGSSSISVPATTTSSAVSIEETKIAVTTESEYFAAGTNVQNSEQEDNDEGSVANSIGNVSFTRQYNLRSQSKLTVPSTDTFSLQSNNIQRGDWRRRGEETDDDSVVSDSVLIRNVDQRHVINNGRRVGSKRSIIRQKSKTEDA